VIPDGPAEGQGPGSQLTRPRVTRLFHSQDLNPMDYKKTVNLPKTSFSMKAT